MLVGSQGQPCFCLVFFCTLSKLSRCMALCTSVFHLFHSVYFTLLKFRLLDTVESIQNHPHLDHDASKNQFFPTTILNVVTNDLSPCAVSCNIKKKNDIWEMHLLSILQRDSSARRLIQLSYLHDYYWLVLRWDTCASHKTSLFLFKNKEYLLTISHLRSDRCSRGACSWSSSNLWQLWLGVLATS